MIGTKLGSYEIQEEIGAGGMGMVYRGRDTLTGQTVAIKSLKSHLPLGGESTTLARFEREGEALRQLNHPNIVKMLAMLQQEGQHYLVMEYVSGGSLYERLRARPQLPVPFVLKVAIELADALTRAHYLKIIHRDVKPANVLLAEDGTARLTDFGVAQFGTKERVTETGTTVGTLDYLSPEALNGDEVDARADIWAFGVMLYEMLAGRRPFQAATFPGIITAILMDPIPNLEALRPDAPLALVDLVYRMLAKDRHARVQSVRRVGAELETIMLGGASGVSVGSSSDRLIEPPRLDQSGRFETPPPAITAIRHNLPASISPLVGREAELAELGRLLNEPQIRLVTILGPGGMGKTRLALEVATQQLPYFIDGVFFVALAPLGSAELILPAIAEAVDFQFSPGGAAKQQLLDYFREKSLLLVLDNFEHLLGGVGLVADILEAAPGVKLVATSREKLSLQAETIFIVEGMAFPERGSAEDLLGYSAVRLFVQDVRRAQPGFQLNEADFSHVVRICHLVQGMPLGLLLAAAWVEMLSLQEIADEISQSLNFLETELHDVPERQRSIRAVFDYSWNLLSQEEQAIFARLSVFRGGFSRQAAQTVAGASLRQLMALLNKSLLWRKPDSGRYEIHELLRQYAEEKLVAAGEAGAIRDRHLDFFVELAEQAEDKLRGPEQRQQLQQLDLELDNFYGALEWSLTQDAQRSADDDRRVRLGLRLAGALTWFWNLRGHWHEGPAWLSRLLAALGASAPTAARAKALVAAANLSCWGNNDYPAARAWLEESLAIYRALPTPEPWGLGYALSLYGEVVGELGETALSQSTLNESLTLGQGLGQAGKWICAAAWMSLASRTDTPSLIEERLEKSAALFRELGDEAQLGAVLVRLAFFYLHQKIYNLAQAYAQESLTLHQRIGDKMGIAWLLKFPGDLALAQADYAQAAAHYEASLKEFKTLGSKEGVAYGLANLGQARLAQGELAGVRALWEESLRLFEEIKHKGGRAWLLRELGGLALVQEDTALALSQYQAALRLYQEMGPRVEVVQALEGLGEAWLRRGEFEQAMILLSAAQALAEAGGWARPAAGQERFEQSLAAVRVALGERADALWASGQSLSLAQVIELALSGNPYYERRNDEYRM